MSLIISKAEQPFIFIFICIPSFVLQLGPLPVFHLSMSSFILSNLLETYHICCKYFLPKMCLTCKIIYGVNHPLTDEWIKKMWYICAVEYHSSFEGNEIMPFAATWMDLEIIVLGEVRRRKTNILWYRLYIESKKNIQMNLFIEQKHSQT